MYCVQSLLLVSPNHEEARRQAPHVFDTSLLQVKLDDAFHISNPGIKVAVLYCKL